MRRKHSYTIVSMLLVSLILSACYTSRSLAVLAERDAHLKRYNELSKTPHELLSPAEASERDRLWIVQQQHAEALVQWGFDAERLAQRDSLIFLEDRFRELLSASPSSLSANEATEREMLSQSNWVRDSTLAVVQAELQGRHLSGSRTIGAVLLGVVVTIVTLGALCAATECLDFGFDGDFLDGFDFDLGF